MCNDFIADFINVDVSKQVPTNSGANVCGTAAMCQSLAEYMLNLHDTLKKNVTNVINLSHIFCD